LKLKTRFTEVAEAVDEDTIWNSSLCQLSGACRRECTYVGSTSEYHVSRTDTERSSAPPAITNAMQKIEMIETNLPQNPEGKPTSKGKGWR